MVISSEQESVTFKNKNNTSTTKFKTQQICTSGGHLRNLCQFLTGRFSILTFEQFSMVSAWLLQNKFSASFSFEMNNYNNLLKGYNTICTVHVYVKQREGYSTCTCI